MADTPDLKVVEFKKPEAPQPPKARMPTERDIEDILQGSALKGLVLTVVNENDDIGYYRTNLSDHEAIGILEETKFLLLGMMDHDEYALED